MGGDSGGATESEAAQVADGAAGGAANGVGADAIAEVGGTGSGVAEKARADYEAVLAERDKRIAELEGEIAGAAKTADAAERLRAEMDELRRQGDAQRVSFELQLAGARNVKAATALLSNYDGDMEKLKGAEPWLFADAAAPRQTGKTGLSNVGAATDEGKTVRRWHEIAGLPTEKGGE